MYEIVVYDKKRIYMINGDSSDPCDYPTIPVGASVFILDTEKVYLKIGPFKYIMVDFYNIPSKNTTSVLGMAIIGTMNIGE
jgi:hypothetical protein